MGLPCAIGWDCVTPRCGDRKRLCPPVGGRLIWSKWFGAGGFCQTLAMEQGLPGCHRLSPLHKGMRGLWEIPGPRGADRGPGEVANRAPYSKRHHCILQMQPGCGVQQGQMGYRAHHCSPNLPQLERCRRMSRQLPSSGEPSSTPNTYYSEMASANTAVIQLACGTALPGGAVPPKRLAAPGVCCMCDPQLAAMPVCARDAYIHGAGVPEPVCTHMHPAGKAIAHMVLAHSRHMHVQAEPLH